MADKNLHEELNEKMFKTLVDSRISSEMKANMFAKFIEDGADVNAKYMYGKTVLMFASERGENEIAKMLIEKGAAER